VGRINHPELAERILADGRVDFLAVGRAHLADPDFLAKARSGKSDQIRKCIACNQGCIDRLFGDKMITCLVNPECGREADFPPRPADRKKRVVIVGGGPAGLQAARIMALRKHEVTLLEKENFLGGQFLAAAVTPKKEDFREAIDFLAKEVREAGVNVKLSTEADERLVKKLNPEVVIVATGSSPVIPKIKGLQNLSVFTAQDVLLGKKEIVFQKILIIGGGMVGVEVADFLGQRGKQVIVVEMTGQLAAGMGAGHWFYVQERLEKYGVEILTNAVVEEVSKKAIVLRLGKEKRTVEGIETIILASGVRPQNEMADKLKGIVAEIHVIGDAREPRNALDAVLEGVEVGEKV
jgi:NADPH-dependent 2,4-dienoyl-CoA reductase/sulfur reductase-like enzyme